MYLSANSLWFVKMDSDSSRGGRIEENWVVRNQNTNRLRRLLRGSMKSAVESVHLYELIEGWIQMSSWWDPYSTFNSQFFASFLRACEIYVNNSNDDRSARYTPHFVFWKKERQIPQLLNNWPLTLTQDGSSSKQWRCATHSMCKHINSVFSSLTVINWAEMVSPKTDFSWLYSFH